MTELHSFKMLQCNTNQHPPIYRNLNKFHTWGPVWILGLINLSELWLLENHTLAKCSVDGKRKEVR